jgi:xanthine dehydrogenase molybdopterin-binding subunit B
LRFDLTFPLFTCANAGDTVLQCRIARAWPTKRALATERCLAGASWSEATIQRAMAILAEEFAADRCQGLQSLPTAGIAEPAPFLPGNSPRKSSVASGSGVCLNEQLRPGVADQPEHGREVRSSESAITARTGEAVYIDDIPEAAGTLHAALGLSEYAHADILAIDLSRVRSWPGVIDVLLAADIPGHNNCGPIIADDPILADKIVSYAGQPIFAVVADSMLHARQAGRQAKVVYRRLPAAVAEAAKQGELIFRRWRETRRCKRHAAAPQNGRSVSGGGQEQFCSRGRSPTRRRTAVCTFTAHSVAHALSSANHIKVETRRMGGVGGRNAICTFACIAATAAPLETVKLRLDRDDDMLVTGKRHDFYFDYEVGFDELAGYWA